VGDAARIRGRLDNVIWIMAERQKVLLRCSGSHSLSYENNNTHNLVLSSAFFRMIVRYQNNRRRVTQLNESHVSMNGMKDLDERGAPSIGMLLNAS
jgi:hypothetical protein